MKSIAYRDIADARRVVKRYVGPLTDMPGQPAHVRRRAAALRELRGLGECVIYITRGPRIRRILVRRA